MYVKIDNSNTADINIEDVYVRDNMIPLHRIIDWILYDLNVKTIIDVQCIPIDLSVENTRTEENSDHTAS